MSLLYTVSYVTPGVVFILVDNYSRLNVLRIENADSFSIRAMSNGRHPRGGKNHPTFLKQVREYVPHG